MTRSSYLHSYAEWSGVANVNPYRSSVACKLSRAGLQVPQSAWGKYVFRELLFVWPKPENCEYTELLQKPTPTILCIHNFLVSVTRKVIPEKCIFPMHFEGLGAQPVKVYMQHYTSMGWHLQRWIIPHTHLLVTAWPYSPLWSWSGNYQVFPVLTHAPADIHAPVLCSGKFRLVGRLLH
jgi:hypothetical protein